MDKGSLVCLDLNTPSTERPTGSPARVEVLQILGAAVIARRPRNQGSECLCPLLVRTRKRRAFGGVTCEPAGQVVRGSVEQLESAG